MNTPVTLSIRNFGQLDAVDLSFGDLTVLVGAQGTGKSLALQWLKVALDGRHIVGALKAAGHPVERPENLLDLVFGSGMGQAWTPGKSAVQWGKGQLLPEKFQRLGAPAERAFFIPAHRSMLISDGWAAPFQKLSADTPVVARIFSQNLFSIFSRNGAGDLFPVPRVLKEPYRDQIDQAIYHGGKVSLVEENLSKRLRLSHGDMHLPFMTWTAGQREFTPLLLGLYHLLTPRKVQKLPDVNWVIIEEPEMGLHPQAVTVVMLLVLDLLWRGYRVALSTHSPYVLDVVWMLQNLKKHKAEPGLISKAFGVTAKTELRKVAEAALGKTYRVHYLSYQEEGKVRSKDISSLDAWSDDTDVAGWGGLSEFSTRFGSAVREAVEKAGG